MRVRIQSSTWGCRVCYVAEARAHGRAAGREDLVMQFLGHGRIFLKCISIALVLHCDGVGGSQYRRQRFNINQSIFTLVLLVDLSCRRI